jgi:hypothetical protein
MKVLYVGLARSLWLFDISLLNPKGMNLQVVIDGIRERYHFAQAPKHQLDLDERRGLLFKSGTFQTSKGTPVFVSFSIYNDGFVADTLSSTDDATEFLNDLTSWIREEYGLAVPTQIRMAYVGQIDFETEAELVLLSPRLREIIKFLGDHVKPPDAKPRQFDVNSLGFWTEDLGQPSAPASFKWERKIGAAFSSNHYFSEAPLETKAHIDLLVEFERLLKEAAN